MGTGINGSPVRNDNDIFPSKGVEQRHGYVCICFLIEYDACDPLAFNDFSIKKKKGKKIHQTETVTGKLIVHCRHTAAGLGEPIVYYRCYCRTSYARAYHGFMKRM